MKFDTSLLRLLSVCSICALSTITPADADSDDDTPLTETMKQSSGALKSLRKIDKDDWAGGAEAARSAADGLRKGMEFVPILIKGMPEGKEKAKALADYRRMMGLSYANLCELEIAYLEEDAEEVDAAMTEVEAGTKEGDTESSEE